MTELGGRSRGRWAAGFVGIAVASSLLFGFAPTAGAADAPTVTIDSPVSGAVSGGPSVTISGRATMHSIVPGVDINRVTRVAVTLSSPANPGPLPACDPCNAAQEFSVGFSWTTPALVYNGPYTVRVVATGREGVDLNGDETGAPATRNFSIAVVPVAPRNVKTTVEPDRSVIVSWTANPEPDVVGYRVQRKDPGGTEFVDAGGLVTPGGAPSLHDPVPASTAGGAYVYRVQAIRNGAGGAGSLIESSFVAADASVPAPPPGAELPPGTGPAGGGEGAPEPAGVVPGAPPSLAGFVAAGRGGGPTASLPKLPGLPKAGVVDNGFDAELPYPAGSRKGLANSARSVALGAAGLASNPRALAVPVAAGLVLGMISFHLRLLSRRMDGTPAAPH